MLRRTSVLASLCLALTVVGVVPAQAVPAPGDTSISLSNTKIYPSINTSQRPGSTVIEVISVSPDEVVSLEVQDAGDSLVKEFTLPPSDTVTWDGRNTAGALVPAGVYTIHLFDGSHAEVDATANVTVSRQHLIRKTYTRVLTAVQHRIAKVVGKCSTLRQPSKRRWKGSLGYYANTRCKTQTWKASSVITGHFVRLPVAERYLNIRVDTYGAAAKAKRRSRAVIEYWAQDRWTAGKFAGPKVGWHNGLTRSTESLVDSERYFLWRFASAYKSRYDVAKFRVVMSYDVLSAT